MEYRKNQHDQFVLRLFDGLDFSENAPCLLIRIDLVALYENRLKVVKSLFHLIFFFIYLF